jgi:hypothetical protein
MYAPTKQEIYLKTKKQSMKSIISGAVIATAMVVCFSVNVKAKSVGHVTTVAVSDTGKMSKDKMSKMDGKSQSKMQSDKMTKKSSSSKMQDDKMSKKKMSKDTGKM